MSDIQENRWEALSCLAERFDYPRFKHIKKVSPWVDLQEDALAQVKMLLDASPKGINGTVTQLQQLLHSAATRVKHEHINGETFVEKFAPKGQNLRLRDIATALHDANALMLERSGPRVLADAYTNDRVRGVDFSSYPSLESLAQEALAMRDGGALSAWLRERYVAYAGMYENKIAGDTFRYFRQEVRTKLIAFYEQCPEYQGYFASCEKEFAAVEKRPTREGIKALATHITTQINEFTKNYHSALETALVRDMKTDRPELENGEVMELIYRLQWARYAGMAAARLQTSTQQHRS